MERYLRVNLLGPGPRRMKKRFYRAAVSQRLRNTAETVDLQCNIVQHVVTSTFATCPLHLMLLRQLNKGRAGAGG